MPLLVPPGAWHPPGHGAWHGRVLRLGREGVKKGGRKGRREGVAEGGGSSWDELTSAGVGLAKGQTGRVLLARGPHFPAQEGVRGKEDQTLEGLPSPAF